MGLRAHLLLLVLLAVLPGLLLSILTNAEQRRSDKARVENDATRVALLAAANQLALVNATRQHLEALNRFPQAARGHDLPSFQMFFMGMKNVYTNYADFGLVETNGALVAHSLSTNSSVSLADRADFQRALATRQFTIGSYQPCEGTVNASLFFANPIFDKSNHLARVAYASLDLDALIRVANESRVPEGGIIEVLGPDRHILARSPNSEEWVGRSVAGSPFAELIMRRLEGTIQTRGFDEIERLFAFTTVRSGPGPGLFVVVGIPTTLAFAETRQAMVRNLMVLGGVALLALLGAWLYANYYILHPVKKLAAVTQRLAAGDLSARTGTVAPTGEFREFTHAFDEMAASLQRQREEIERSEREIRALNTGLEHRVAERTQLLKQANAELEAFSSSVSHDLRSPLRHIHSYAEMLHEDFGPALGQSGGRMLGAIKKSSLRMATLIEDLLSFSRMGRSELDVGPVKMEDLVHEVIAEMEADLRDRTIHWKIGPLPEAIVDRSMLKQVWTNLLSNAVKYTRQRESAQIEIKCGRNDSSSWEFSVQDNGAGFKMEYADNLFSAFQRLHSQDEFEGTGLGLANVRRIIERHGGKTWAHGVEGQGSTFYFTLPLSLNAGIGAAVSSPA